MTARGFYTLLFGLIMLFTALSVGSAGAFLLGAGALIACALAFFSVLIAYLTCRLSQKTDLSETPRGGVCLFSLSVTLFAPLPIAPLGLRVSTPSGRQSDFTLRTRLLGTTVSENAFSCPHVGLYPVGVQQVTFADCFGLFSLHTAVRQQMLCVCVLPVPADAADLPVSPGEGENTTAARAQADRTTPADTRLWQEGDELGRVHWKLSMRRQALMVHTYETPQRPDALVFLDLSAPCAGQAEGAVRARLIDALTETACGVMKTLLENGRMARMPLSGDHPVELSGQSIQALARVQRALAQESFRTHTDFARVLLLSGRRMRRTGSAAVVTSNLTPAVADAVLALMRMGPRIHLILVTASEMTAPQTQLMHLLAVSGIETEHTAA